MLIFLTLFIDSGTDINAKTTDDQTALMIASKNEHK